MIDDSNRNHEELIMTEPNAVRLTPKSALLVLIAIITLVTGYMLLGTALGVSDYLAMGFMFALYWGGIKGMEPSEFAPAVLGSLSGIGLAYAVHVVPNAMGTLGLVAVLTTIIAIVYASLLHILPMIINNALMLYLTIGTASFFNQHEGFLKSVVAVILIAAYTGVLNIVIRKLKSRMRAL